MKKLPGSKNCFVCGRNNPHSLKMEFFVNDEGEVVASTAIPSGYEGYPGMAHGGIIVAILDEASGRAVTTDDPNRFFVTSELNVKYRKPVPTEKLITVKASITKNRGKVRWGHGEIQDEAGILLAESNAVFVDLTPSDFSQQNPEITGWKVYPDE